MHGFIAQAVREVHREVLPLSPGHCCAAMEVTLADGELHELQERVFHT